MDHDQVFLRSRGNHNGQWQKQQQQSLLDIFKHTAEDDDVRTGSQWSQVKAKQQYDSGTMTRHFSLVMILEIAEWWLV